MGSESNSNADTLYAAGQITKAERDKMKKDAKEGKKTRKRSLFDILRGK